MSSQTKQIPPAETAQLIELFLEIFSPQDSPAASEDAISKFAPKDLHLQFEKIGRSKDLHLQFEKIGRSKENPHRKFFFSEGKDSVLAARDDYRIFVEAKARVGNDPRAFHDRVEVALAALSHEGVSSFERALELFLHADQVENNALAYNQIAISPFRNSLSGSYGNFPPTFNMIDIMRQKRILQFALISKFRSDFLVEAAKHFQLPSGSSPRSFAAVLDYEPDSFLGVYKVQSPPARLSVFPESFFDAASAAETFVHHCAKVDVTDMPVAVIETAACLIADNEYLGVEAAFEMASALEDF